MQPFTKEQNREFNFRNANPNYEMKSKEIIKACSQSLNVCAWNELYTENILFLNNDKWFNYSGGIRMQNRILNVII